MKGSKECPYDKTQHASFRGSPFYQAPDQTTLKQQSNGEERRKLDGELNHLSFLFVCLSCETNCIQRERTFRHRNTDKHACVPTQPPTPPSPHRNEVLYRTPQTPPPPHQCRLTTSPLSKGVVDSSRQSSHFRLLVLL